jgi:hypothetical protein
MSIVNRFVDGGQGKALGNIRFLDELESSIDRLVRIFKSSLVLEPAIVPLLFTQPHAVQTSRERVNVEDDVHAMLLYA